ncbi:MAG: D-alanyl-D-alanine carboxypeptidase [Desulfobacteraceae bacterium]|nr:D-alanyl-D-alanine carboxypeptidase [Desulfobacteraceae bacterium]
MRRDRIFCLILAVLFALLTLPFPASAAEQPAGRKAGRGQAAAKQKAAAKAERPKGTGAATELSPGQINARSAILVELSTGTVLFEQNADEPIEPASFTKIASLYLIFEGLQQGRINLNDQVWISEAAWRTGGSKMFVGIGTRVPLEDLIKGIAVVSGNDACVAAAEHLSGSQDTFVDALNRKAKELGMTKSYFVNPHGLPADGQITSARDMVTLDAAYLRNFPEALRFHSLREYTYNNIVQYNRNHLLLKDQTIDGLKTGYIAASGYHLSATSQRDGMRLIAVVMGAVNPATREREALKLLNYGFRHYTLVQPFQDGQAITTAKVFKGEKNEVPLYAKDKATFLIPQTQKNLLRWEVRPAAELTAPVSANQEAGELVFFVSDQPRRTVKLITKEEVPLGGIFKRMWQSVFNIPSLDWKWITAILGGIAVVGILLVLFAGRTRSRRTF